MLPPWICTGHLWISTLRPVTICHQKVSTSLNRKNMQMALLEIVCTVWGWLCWLPGGFAKHVSRGRGAMDQWVWGSTGFISRKEALTDRQGDEGGLNLKQFSLWFSCGTLQAFLSLVGNERSILGRAVCFEGDTQDSR